VPTRKLILPLLLGLIITLTILSGLDQITQALAGPTAATITVTNLNDSGPGSLRQAIADAVDGDSINFSVTGSIILTSDQLILTKDITITGPGKDQLYISGGTQFRVFMIPTGDYDISITDLSIMDGTDTEYYDPLTFESYDDRGGGMVNASSGTVTLENVNFYLNNSAYYGGGLYQRGSSLILSNVLFDTNSAIEGGGLHIEFNADNSSIQMTAVTFQENTAGQGGGISYLGNTSNHNIEMETVAFLTNNATNGGGLYSNSFDNYAYFQLMNVSFIGNLAGEDGGGLYSNGIHDIEMTNVDYSINTAVGNGGGFYTEGGTSLWIESIGFSGNSADLDGGGLYCSTCIIYPTSGVTFTENTAISGGGMYIETSPSPDLKDMVFSNNTASWKGGGLYLQSSSNPHLSAVTFSENTAFEGGGLYVTDSSQSELTNVTFSGNIAHTHGGGCYDNASVSQMTNTFFSGNWTGGDGGGMYTSGSSLTFRNVTFASNLAASFGGGLRNIASQIILENGIFLGNTAYAEGLQLYNESTLEVYNSNIQGCGSGGWGSALYCGTDLGNNIDVDPRFRRDPDSGDGDWSSRGDNDYGNLRLTPLSPAMNAGNNTNCPATDLDGVSRPQNGTCDMGAYEFEPVHRLYVDADAVGGDATGLSWPNAFTTLQDALAVNIDYDEIWVAEGVYYPDEGFGQTDDTRSSVFELKTGVALYGGFDPSSGVDEFADRDWATYPTVLSGDLAQDDHADPTGVVTDTDNLIGNNNSYHVVYGFGVTTTAQMDGFFITAGKANGSDSAEDGGGINLINASPTLSNLYIAGNYATYGGGMHLRWACSPNLTQVTFANNTTPNAGGGIYNISTAMPTLNAVTFSENLAYHGGGLFNNSSAAQIIGGVFANNTATSVGGGYYGDRSTLWVDQSEFRANKAEWAGGLFNLTGSITLTNSIIAENEATKEGGGIYTAGDLNATNLTIVANQATTGGGLYTHLPPGTTTIKNTIIWGNIATADPQISNEGATQPTISYSDIQNSGGSASWDTNLGTDGGGNLDAAPLFMSGLTDLRLQLQSPALHAGTNSGCPRTDLDHSSRPFGAYCDMGAYEASFSPVYVDLQASGAQTGLSWTDAYTTLQDALTHVISGTEIWVAAGVYYPDDGVNQTAAVVTSTFVLTDGVAVYGGFAGTESSLAHRDWRTNVTILSGDLTQDDTTRHGVVTATDHISGTNAYHVVFSRGTAETAILDGFILTAGQATGPNQHDDGGGMYNTASSPTLTNLLFSGNYASHNGGALFNANSSSPQLTTVTFTGNHGNYRGGAIANMYACNPDFTNVIIAGNSAASGGGAMFNRQSSPTFTNVTIAGNHTNSKGGGLYNWETSYPTLTNTIIWGNTANTGNAQIYNRDGATPVVSYTDIQGSGGSDSWDTTLGTDGGNNHAVDPQFFSDYDDLHLNAITAIVDSADSNYCPSTDIDGLPRGTTCDMGACEYRYRVYFPVVVR
jgi:predicted outer membrane repeat protein/parallel beta-helix repeat protein